MKLNGLYIQESGICKQLKIENLEPGFNLIFGRNGSGKSTLVNFVGNTFYGFPGNSSPHSGYLEVSCQDARTRIAAEPRTPAPWKESPNWLQSEMVDQTLFETAFMIDGRGLLERSNRLVDLLCSRFHVPQGKSALGNDLLFQNATQTIAILQSRLDGIVLEIRKLETERNQLVQQIDQEENVYQAKRRDLDRAIQQLTTQIDAFDLNSIQHRIEWLDREIIDLRSQIEMSANAVPDVSTAGHVNVTDKLATTYLRLDENDQQIRRWRSVQAEVQQHRVDLKDEMVQWKELTMESQSHPYHRSAKLVNAIESRLRSAENAIHEYRQQHGDQELNLAGHWSDCCKKIRVDLQALCDELSAQFKSVRHRSAAAQLKRLRNCYQEIGHNIDALVEKRRLLIEEIRQQDPAGAVAIEGCDPEFQNYAQQEGYLQARQRFVGKLEVEKKVDFIAVDLAQERTKLTLLQQQRAQLVKELVRLENQLSGLKAQRKSLIAQLQIGHSPIDLSEVRSRLEITQRGLNVAIEEQQKIHGELQWNRNIRPEPANVILDSACQWIQQLTNGEIRRVWISSGVNRAIEIENRQQENFELTQLGSGQQQQVMLGICLAIIQNCQQTGQQPPVLLDDVFVNLDPELIEATLNTLIEFCRQGHQAIALTSDQLVMDLAVSRGIRRYDMPVFDLPETSVTPIVPIWNPDRRGDSPYPAEDYETYPEPFQTEPEISKPPFQTPPTRLAHHEFDDLINPLGSNQTPRQIGSDLENGFSESSPIERLQIDPVLIPQFKALGVDDLGKLLELDPGAAIEIADLPAQEIDYWQALAWLLICVPALAIEDGQMLIELGILEPEQLESTHAQQLVDRISRFLNSSAGRQSGLARNYNRETISRWYESLGETRSRWRLPSGYSRRNRWQRAVRHSLTESRTQRTSREPAVGGRKVERHSRRERKPRSRFELNSPIRYPHSVDKRDPIKRQTVETQTQTPTDTRDSNQKPVDSPSTLKFYLNQSDELEAAPSIGPKTAERFSKIGVQSVGEFLTQTAESMASKLAYKRISADVIRQWQHQARMVCRVPNLRGHDAQLLVACGITEPEDLAAYSVEKLFAIIQPFSESKEGLKIIRSGKQPDLEEITDWIDWAQDTRSLQAA